MSALSAPTLATLCEDVQSNCAISDARYARDYSLCVYLLRMREFYRWRQGIALMQPLDTNTVGEWISETESYWDEIEESEFHSLRIDEELIDPFDARAINARLNSTGLIYSAGYGRLGQPHFVLAELQHAKSEATLQSYDCGKELARDSITMPAMTQNETIYIRHDSIKRHIWQMLDEWRLQRKAGPLSRVAAHFGLDDHTALDTRLEQAAVQLSNLYRVHEVGEFRVSEMLDARYHHHLQAVIGTPNEFYLRAVRDILADSLETWPYLIAKGSDIELDFWLGSLAGVRIKLLGATGMIAKLENVASAESRLDKLADLIETEQHRWQFIIDQLLGEPASTTKKENIQAQTLQLIERWEAESA